MNTPSSFPANPILIVDDEKESLRSFSLTLRMNEIGNIEECQDSREVVHLLSKHPYDAILLDLTMPFVSGEEILAVVAERFPEIPVIVVTAMDEVDTAVRCIKKGALDYMVKPVEKIRLVSGVRRAIELKELRDQSRRLKDHMLSGELQNPDAFSHMLTRDRAMLSIFQYVESIGPSREAVLVTGETGVGKELMVKAVHAVSAPDGPLVSVNVAGLDDNVFSDTLFGHAKGAFTGAEKPRQGLVEKAGGGTLHLDEIGDLRIESQVKLLRLLQEREYFPLGSDTARKAGTRVVATTNRDLSKLRDAGGFRQDLFYRLSTHHIHIPPLRERPDDIPLLLGHFSEEAALSLGRVCPTYPEEVVSSLLRHLFPGNVRELKTLIYDAVTGNKAGKLSLKDFKGRLQKEAAASKDSTVPEDESRRMEAMNGSLPTLQEATERLIKKALERCNNNQSAAARLLGISRQRLARQLKDRTY
ncbi:MAG: sigma-54 dependent transcriptional regulator [Pseudomonadota bacterium]